MMRMILIAGVVLVAVSSGCSWTKKPMSQDPLVQKKRAIPGDMRAMPKVCETDHPCPPGPPTDELAK